MRVKSRSPRFQFFVLFEEGEGKDKKERKRNKNTTVPTEYLCTFQGVRKRWDCMNTTRDRGRLRVRE